MPFTPYTKPALTYAEQIQQVQLRGLIIENEIKARHILENLSYYRLSGYWYSMLEDPKENHLFKPGSNFDNAFKLYCFDKELRKLVLTELEKIEVAIRAKLIYVLSHAHGPFWYLHSSLFKNNSTYSSIFSKIQDEYSRCDDQFIVSFKNKYDEPFPPSWMMFELTSFGTLSRVYKNLNVIFERRAIGNYFGLDDKTFESWLHCLVYARNICAHHSRLWNRVMRITPSIPQKPLNTFLEHTLIYDSIEKRPLNNNKAYFLFSMIIYLLNIIDPKNQFKIKFQNLLEKYQMIDIKAMGVHDDWAKEEIWK